ncbi:hypothetical protein KY315_02960, partial [Candidatus Woesearchaeota archaeon]|nr:hypothetical protein [Candidatus Woesearchaeota archaeon]
SITVTNINTGGAVVTLGGTVNAVDVDGFYIGTSGGTDVGCTSGGVTVTYSFETRDIFCDQVTAPVETAITNETASIRFDMLESDADNLQLAIQQCTYTQDAGVANKIGVGGIITVNFTPLMLEITDNDDTSLKTTWTFFKTLSGGIETNFERENPTAVTVTFTAYADTTHASGHQLFSVNEALS